MPVKPMLDDLELPLVQQLDAAEHQERAQHAVPALEGDFLQGLGRRATAFTLAGVIANEDGTVGEELKNLREKFRAAAPVDFVADIATATRVDTVLIEEMSVRELAGKPERFEYAFALREYIPAPAPEIEPPPPPPPPLETSLIVEVIVTGQPGYDFSQVDVTVKGTQDDGASIDQPLTNQQNNVWTEETFPPGSYTVRATGPDPVVPNTVMVKEERAEILEGEKEKVVIELTPGQRRNVAIAHVIHYWFDKAFIEPCLRPVLREVVQYAAEHDTEKLLIVGHTDLVGSDNYNQALSERRARGVYAYLTFGNDANAAVAEWNELRKARTNGLNDVWGVREYQYMLQDLGYYVGPINERHDGNTDDAVRAFQRAKELPEDGIVGNATWPVLIHDYLAQDSLSIDESRFFRNARDGCDGGPLLWLGCSELDPVDNRKTAWRPNRRTEMLFVAADEIPCEVPRPVTWDIRPDGSSTPQWCLGPGNKNKPCCFLSREAEAPDKWLVQPAHPEKVKVSGRITYEDGTSYANKQFSLIAPDGEFLHTDAAGQPDLGEVPTRIPGPPLIKAGRPIYDRTDDDGRFTYPKDTPVGTYILELPDLNAPQVARDAAAPPHTARGNVVCLAYTPGTTQNNVIIQPGPVPATPVNPTITLATPFVAVKKPHTNPPRVQVTLRADAAFNGTGTLDRSGNTAAVRLFTAAVGGTEITFDGTDNVFPGANLTAGVQLFAEAGPAPSGAVNDYTLTLTLNPTGSATPAGPPATASLTAVLFTLDIALSRPAPGAAPPVMSEADKINVGRHVQLQDATFSPERAMLIVRQPTPPVAATLELLPQNGRVQAFTVETPAAGQAPIAAPLVLAPGSVPAAGSQFFVEGATVSTAVRDTGYLLRVQELGAEVDRVMITTAQLEVTAEANNAATGLRFVRFGLWDEAYDANGEVKTAADEANHFIGQDARKLHFRLRDVSQNDNVEADWITLRADGVTNDDAPTRPAQSPVIHLVANPAGSNVFISRALILVIDDVNLNFPTESGLSAPLPTGPRAAGQSNHRTRRARMDGFIRVEYSPQAGVRLRLTLPVFDRAVPFSTTSAAAIATGVQTVTPAAMSVRSNGVLCNIAVGSELTIGAGAVQETVTVTATTANTFTAAFLNAHAAPVAIAGTADERQRVRCRVIRYTGVGVPGWITATPGYIGDQFERANLHWNQIGFQIDADPTQVRAIPPNALFPPGAPPPNPSIVANKYPFIPPLGNSPQQTAVLADLLPITPDNTLTVIFLDLTGPANAYAAIANIVPDPVPIPGGAPIAIGDRFFIFMDSNLDLVDETLAHELHHVIFNRFDLSPALLTTPDQAFYTLNTRSPQAWVARAAAQVPPVVIVLPDVRVYWRLQNRNSPDPNNDPNNNNIVNWARRQRTARFPQPFNFSPADGTTGNNFSEDF